MTAQADPTVVEREPSPAAAAPEPARPRRRIARWRPSAALLAILLALLLSQALAFAIVVAAGGEDAPRGIIAVALVLADLVIVGVVVAFARRGAERLGPATLGIRRTRFWPALGWMLVVYFGIGAFEAIWGYLVGSGGAEGGGGGHGSPSLPAALGLLFAIAVMAPIAEEIAFRGYLFPALTRWRGPWIGALATALLFGLAHVATYPPQILPMMVAFGYGACMLYWFTGSLLPCVALHALNNAIVTGVLLHWTWQVPVGALGCIAVALALLAPFARERAPKAAVAPA